MICINDKLCIVYEVCIFVSLFTTITANHRFFITICFYLHLFVVLFTLFMCIVSIFSVIDRSLAKLVDETGDSCGNPSNVSQFQDELEHWQRTLGVVGEETVMPSHDKRRLHF